MLNIRQYIVTIIAAATVVAMLEQISQSVSLKKMVRMVTGLILSVLLLSPLGKLDISSYTSFIRTANLDAMTTVSNGETIYRENLDAIITQRCETYILDRANQIGANIAVMIECDDSDVPIPVYAEITGAASPYARKTIQDIIAADIGIPKENQQWA